uniref:Uncharacterized protein n=1 Tax=Rhizophora mucronata TaxID=61149 RepID=A0A2P2QTF9_RHIMU
MFFLLSSQFLDFNLHILIIILLVLLKREIFCIHVHSYSL